MTQPGGSGNDVIGDFQRWLLRAGARGMSRELADQVRTALGKTQQQTSGDVWKTATAEPAPGEAPECAWCPLCRAARLVREAKPTRDTRVAAVGDALTTVVQDAVSVLEAALAATSRGGAGPNGKGTETGPGTRGFAAAGSAAAQAPPSPAAQAPASPAAQAPPAGPAAQAAPGADGQAAPGADGQAAPGADGQAAPAADDQAAPEPPEESPHEPDDRG